MAKHLKTHNPVTVAIDEVCRSAHGSVQWFLENKPDYKAPPVTQGNRLQFLICGQEGFAAIAKDLREAKESADIICWGFDPGMELERQAGVWPRGTTFGDLLEQISARGVKVRLLVWFDTAASVVQNNLPGCTDYPIPGSPYDSDARQKYCRAWWARHLRADRASLNPAPNLQILVRKVSIADARAAMHDEEDDLTLPEAITLEGFGTHHQKPVLIDYAYDGGRKAVGYVMGLNSVTDFWDRTEHLVDDPLREAWSSGKVRKEIKHETATEGTASAAWYRQTKPYQDYACRIEGPALADVHQNFVTAWNRDAPIAWRFPMNDLPPNIKPTVGGNAVQIVRTQPQEQEKTIKALYFQATSSARNYIYIENQYFFYPEFARHLKNARLGFCRAWSNCSGKPIAEVPKLHLFIVLPHPEQDGMVPRTLDTLIELGKSGAMPKQVELVDAGEVDQDYVNAQKGPKGNQVLDRPSLQELEDTYGLKVSVARLRTSGLDANNRLAYREIYIHSKLMLIDDVFVTLGSANINQRSMAVDSEINMAATGLAKVSGLRQRVFELHSGGDISGTGDRDQVPKVFQDWAEQINDNRDIQIAAVKNLKGFLLPFEDHRSTTLMVASVTVPTSNVSV